MQEKFDFKPNQLVMFDNGEVRGHGRIVGCVNTEMPIIGRTYMVKVEEAEGIDPETYPFDTIAVAKIHLAPLEKE
jgi:hypothetical protein